MASARHFRPLLITGGSPRVPVDAVRHLSVAATGRTTLALRERLRTEGLDAHCLLSLDAAADPEAERYRDRAELDAAVRAWVGAHPEGVVVMTAAINDYQVAGTEIERDGQRQAMAPGAKIPSRADAVWIRLKPAPKLIDQLAAWGHRGPLVACKFEAAATVVQSARALRERVGAAFVIANSIDASVQVVLDESGETAFPDRDALLDGVTERLVALARR